MAPEENETQAPTQAPTQPTQACRELNWDELNDSQKIERLRGVVKHLDKALAEERTNNRRMATSFINHSHQNDGKVVVPVDATRLQEAHRFDSGPLRIEQNPWL